MTQFLLTLVLAANMLLNWQPFDAQFVRSAMGQNVTICLDGQNVHQTFAGKLAFRDNSGTWFSVCADVRSPIQEGQISRSHPSRSAKVGGNIARAGNIVAHFFQKAQTPEQCAGLQLAVWKVIEDGPESCDFTIGRFQAIASPTVIAYAQQYFQAAETVEAPSSALYLAAQSGQSQLSYTNTLNSGN